MMISFFTFEQRIFAVDIEQRYGDEEIWTMNINVWWWCCFEGLTTR